MATTLELPTKRSSEEMGSGSGLDLDIIEVPLVEWRRREDELYWGCKAREMHYYLSSKGRTDQAKEIQSSEDDLASSIDPDEEFRNKGWVLRPNPGPYSDYECLYVGDIYFCYDELTGEYVSYFLSRDDDLALREFYKELRSSDTVPWNLSWSDAQRIVDGAKPKYPGLESFLAQAVQETIS